MQTIRRALKILEIFLSREGEVGLLELTKLSGLNISTVHRIVSVLVTCGYLNQQRKRGEYSLGLKFLEFSNIVKKRLKIRDMALPFLQQLNEVIGETINLAVLDANEAVIIEMFESGHALRMFSGAGQRIPLHCTALGKIFLAHTIEEEVERFLNGNGLPYYTKNTITGFGKLKKELSIVKQEGIAKDDEEYELGARCVAAPIRDCDENVVAAISASGASVRLTDKRVEELTLLVRSCALRISRAMGYMGH